MCLNINLIYVNTLYQCLRHLLYDQFHIRCPAKMTATIITISMVFCFYHVILL